MITGFSRAAAALACLLAASGISAQSYPQKPIRFVVPQAAGSTTDLLGRIVGGAMSDNIGQPVVTEARPGAGGVVGTDAVAKAAADGYTILLGNISTHGVNPSLYPKLPYNAVEDFAPISMLAITDNVLVTHPSLPAANVKDLVGLAKQRPGAINFSSPGSGSAQHLALELLSGMAGIKMLHVPYKGGNPAITAVVSGEATIMLPTLPLALPHINSRKVKLIAVASAKRLTKYPNVPTVAETLPGYEVVSWFGMLAPAGTPPAIIARLNQAVVAALNNSDVVAKLATNGLETRSSSPPQFAAFINAEITKWTKVVKSSNIRLD